MTPVNILEEVVGEPNQNTIRVLVTGFGPFWRYKENPSWSAVKPLHNTILYVEPSSDPVFVQTSQGLPTQTPATHISDVHVAQMGHVGLDDQLDLMSVDETDSTRQKPVQVHITALQLPVVYQAVLSTVPGLHSLPPILPESLNGDIILPDPPESGYDFIFHVGAAGRGHLRIEQLAHKHGYRMKDADGQYAPVVLVTKEALKENKEADAETLEAQQNIVPVTDIGPPPNPHPSATFPAPVPLPPASGPPLDEPSPPDMNGEAAEVVPPVVETHEQPAVRGYGPGYEQFSDELPTEIDVASLIHNMKESGHTQVYSSMDAGHYICDFLFYGSLAEAKRVAVNKEKDKLRTTPMRPTPVLFMHCPPDGQPLKTEAVTDAIKYIVAWVCRRTRP